MSDLLAKLKDNPSEFTIEDKQSGYYTWLIVLWFLPNARVTEWSIVPDCKSGALWAAEVQILPRALKNLRPNFSV